MTVTLPRYSPPNLFQHESVHRAERYLAAHGRRLVDARRGDLEAFLADLLARRARYTGTIRRGPASSRIGLSRSCPDEPLSDNHACIPKMVLTEMFSATRIDVAAPRIATMGGIAGWPNERRSKGARHAAAEAAGTAGRS